MSKTTYIGNVSALDKSAREVPHVDPPKRTQAEVDRRNAIMYDGNAAVPDLEVPPGQIHGPAHLVGVLERRLPELWIEAGIGAEEQQALRSNIVKMHHEVGLDEVLSAKLADWVIDATLAEARSTDPEADAVALEARILSDTAASRQALLGKYGKDAESMLERTRRFVQARPGLAKALESNGLGSRPETVLAIAAHVFSLGVQ